MIPVPDWAITMHGEQALEYRLGVKDVAALLDATPRQVYNWSDPDRGLVDWRGERREQMVLDSHRWYGERGRMSFRLSDVMEFAAQRDRVVYGQGINWDALDPVLRREWNVDQLLDKLDQMSRNEQNETEGGSA